MVYPAFDVMQFQHVIAGVEALFSVHGLYAAYLELHDGSWWL